MFLNILLQLVTLFLSRNEFNFDNVIQYNITQHPYQQVTQIWTRREEAAILEFCFWTLVRDFTDYFSNVNVQLLKVEFDINPEERSEKIAWTGL